MPFALATTPLAPPQETAEATPGRRSRRRGVAAVAGHAAVAVCLVAVAAWLRAGPLGPSSLWLDDAWVALVARADGAGASLMVGMTAPGFAFLLQAWLAVVGFTEARAQALPFVLGIVGPALLYLLAVRGRLRPVAAAVGAAFLATAPIHVEYATRVKHYTLDAVLALALIAVAWWALDDLSRPRRWFVVAGVAVAATAASGALAAYAAAAVVAGAIALRPGAPGATWAARRAGLGALAGYALFAVVWWWAVLRPVLNPHLRTYWADRYIDVGAGASAAAGALGRNLAAVLEGLSAAPVPVIALLVLGGTGVLAARRPAIAALLAVPVVVAVALAALQMSPLGGGRTDTYLYPGLALLAAAGIDGLWRVRWVAVPAAWVAVPAALAVAASLAITASTPDPYPSQDVRPLVAEVDRRAGPGDAIVVYPATIWAYALYTDRPVGLVTDRSQGWGFEPVIEDPRVARLGRHRAHPERYAPELDRIVGDHDDVWLIATHWRDDLAVIDAHLSEAGLEEVDRWERAGARLSRFTPG